MATILLAALVGIAVLLAGNLPWAGFAGVSGLAAWNLKVGTAVPWAVLPMTAYLLVYWRVIGGGWLSGDSAAERRKNLRANPLPPKLWLASLAAGVAGIGALIALLMTAGRLIHLPASQPIVTPPSMPVATAFAVIAMQSIVAGVTEEAAFRGYMQSMVEREYGVAVAIVANGTLFGLLHVGNHPGDVLVMLPYYIAVSAVYGGLTWASNSILPAIVIHSLADIVVLTRWWATGIPEWQLTSASAPLVRASGIDRAFVIAAGIAIVLTTLTVYAYRAIWRLRTLQTTVQAHAP